MSKKKLPGDGFPVVALPMGPGPEPDFADSICLVGPCAHLWQLTTSFEHGNTPGTFAPGKEPRAIHRSCLRSPSSEMELDGVTVHTCNGHSNPNCRKDPEPFVFDEKETK